MFGRGKIDDGILSFANFVTNKFLFFLLKVSDVEEEEVVEVVTERKTRLLLLSNWMPS